MYSRPPPLASPPPHHLASPLLSPRPPKEGEFSRRAMTPPAPRGKARLTKAIKRTLASVLAPAAAHYLAAQWISKAVHDAQQRSK